MALISNVIAAGVAASRPAAASSNNGHLYLATDTNGGTTYRSNGSSWVQVGKGVSESAANTFAGCRVYNSAAISATNSTVTTLTYDTEIFDTDAYHSTVSNTGRITIPAGKGGKYLFVANFAYANNGTGYRNHWIIENATDIISNDTKVPHATPNLGCNLTAIYDASVADYYEVQVFQTSGGALNVQALTRYSPDFSCVYLGA